MPLPGTFSLEWTRVSDFPPRLWMLETQSGCRGTGAVPRAKRFKAPLKVSADLGTFLAPCAGKLEAGQITGVEPNFSQFLWAEMTA